MYYRIVQFSTVKIRKTMRIELYADKSFIAVFVFRSFLTNKRKKTKLITAIIVVIFMIFIEIGPDPSSCTMFYHLYLIFQRSECILYKSQMDSGMNSVPKITFILSPNSVPNTGSP